MRTSGLKKLLRIATPGNVPADLRDRLVLTIPGYFRQPAQEEARTWRHMFSPAQHKWAYAAVLTAMIAVTAYTGFIKITGPSGINLVPEAVAAVIEQLNETGAFYIELDQRTSGRENFEHIDPENNFVRMGIWIERPSERFSKGRMKLDKPDRKIVFNGDSTLLHMRFPGLGDEAIISGGGRIDRQLADPAGWFEEHFPITDGNGKLDTIVHNDGASIISLTVRMSGTQITNGRPAFYSEFDRKTVLSWNSSTQRLTGLEKYVMQKGKEVQVAQLKSIKFFERLDDSVFAFDLPAGTHIREMMPPGNKQYNAMEPEEVAHFLFDAWKNEEWDNVKIFCHSFIVVRWMQSNPLANFRITGPKYKRNPKYPGYHVPYELVMKNGQVRSHAIALRNDNKIRRYVWDGGI